jgi:DNA helicase HerA-like ATPase
VRLIRSKGVGVYFVTQNPRDLPESVLAQLGCRIQHALRAYTPTERKGVKAAAQSFRPNPNIDTEAAITELGTGEALVSTLDMKGAPTVVERTLIRPPGSRLGPASEEERAAVQAASPVQGKYDAVIDRESAFEILGGRQAKAAKDAAELKAKEDREKAEAAEKRKAAAPPYTMTPPKAPPAKKAPARKRASTRQTPTEAATNTFMRTATREMTKYLFRGIFGNRKR